MKSKLLLLLLIIVTLKCFSQTITYNKFRDHVLKEYNFKKYYDSKNNLFRKDNNVHIFIDEQGNLTDIDIPTTATVHNSCIRL